MTLSQVLCPASKISFDYGRIDAVIGLSRRGLFFYDFKGWHGRLGLYEIFYDPFA